MPSQSSWKLPSFSRGDMLEEDLRGRGGGEGGVCEDGNEYGGWRWRGVTGRRDK